MTRIGLLLMTKVTMPLVAEGLANEEENSLLVDLHRRSAFVRVNELVTQDKDSNASCLQKA